MNYTLKHKWLFFVPIVGIIYLIAIGNKIGFLTKLSNLTGWQSLTGCVIHAWSMVALLFLL